MCLRKSFPYIKFISGGGGGIGRAVCQKMAEKGATVIAADVNHSAAKDTLKQLKG